MKINKLILKNFRSYEEETVFDFTTTNEKNIILIGGKNGSGKSSIFEAIKLCIYGPIAYKYQGFNSSYVSKIKSNINNNSLKNGIVDSFVSIDIEINENAEKNIYTLVRKWTFENQKLEEKFLVYKNFSNLPLDSEELNYFENYITAIISPKIFEFFFFDGEHLSEFFIGNKSNLHLKQSLLSLCNFDTFDVLKNTVISNIKYNKNNNTQIEIARDEYLELEEKINEVTSEKESIMDKLCELHNKLDILKDLKSKTEKEFEKKGGILVEERKNLNSKIIELESRRNIINQTIKDFCNEILPFLMLGDKIKILKKQIKLENQYMLYNQFKDIINTDYIKNLLLNKINNSLIDEVSTTVSKALIEDIVPKDLPNNFEPIYMLSSDISNSLLSQIDSLLGFNNSSILNLFEEYRSIGLKLANIRSKLNSSLDDKSLNKYIKEISDLSNKIGKLSENETNLLSALDKLEKKLEKLTLNKDKSKAKYIELLQANSVTDMSSKLIIMLEDIINTLTENKSKEIQENFMYIFKKIIQKDNFIDFIDINKDFNVSLYINKSYSSLEIKNLIENIGYDDMKKKFGNLFFDDLFKEYNVRNKNELFRAIKNNPNKKFIKLRTKVKIDEFSSGEKQIYILCLYWALIKSSNIKLPFIIDTPYARIDETHRNNITREYFTTISDQVIILSTNTEIDKKSYNEIKPMLNGEYLIKYDDENRKTIQTKGYFFEV